MSIAIVALEAIGALQSLQVQRRVQPLMAELMSTIPQLAPSGQVPPFVKTMTSALSGVSAMPLVFTCGWGLLKIFACLYARQAARKPAVQAWVAGWART